MGKSNQIKKEREKISQFLKGNINELSVDLKEKLSRYHLCFSLFSHNRCREETISLMVKIFSKKTNAYGKSNAHRDFKESIGLFGIK